jgi:hypothetical protein
VSRALRTLAGAVLVGSGLVALFTTGFVTGACTGAASPANDAAPPALGNRATEQRNGECPSPPRILIGVKPPGGSCANAGDCKPVCCACDASVRHWLAAASEGATPACADEVATCVTTASTTLCE